VARDADEVVALLDAWGVPRARRIHEPNRVGPPQPLPMETVWGGAP
jgi:hypothetical protein